jgi:23S rRNA (guanine1835-N2)-methyltransferase
LRAWNGADELLLAHAVDNSELGACVLAVNDQHGALCLGLDNCHVWTDSYLSEIAIRQNWRLNHQVGNPHIVPFTEDLQPQYELVLVKIPKDINLFQHQLDRLKRSMKPGTFIVCGGMDKHLSPKTAQLIEAVLGPTQRLRGRRKARLFVSQVATATYNSDIESEWQFNVPGLDKPISSSAGVFSSKQLDIGSRFLLEQFEQLPAVKTVLDLACGNGVLGLAAAYKLPGAKLVFVDESFSAIQDTRHNWEAHHASRDAQFIVADGLLDYAHTAPDLILCNPPFHQQHQVNEYFGKRLVKQAVQVLRPGGRLWLVTNRHLSYGDMLRRRCSQLNKLAENRKFVAWEAIQ